MLILMSSGEIWSAQWVLDGPALAVALMTSLCSLMCEGIKMERILLADWRSADAMWYHMEPAHPTPSQPQA